MDHLKEKEYLAEIANLKKKIKESEFKCKVMIEDACDWETWQDETGKYMYISSVCQSISGYSKDDFIDNQSLFFEIILEEDREIWLNQWNRIREEKCGHSEQFRIKSKEGRILWIEHTCKPIIDGNGVWLGCRSLIIDRIHMKHLEKVSKENEVLFQSVIENLPYSVSIVTEEGGLLYLNSRGLEMFELGEDMADARHFNSFWLDLEKQNHWLESIKVKGIAKDIEIQMQTQSGKPLWILASGLSIQYQNKNCILSIFQDVTDCKNAEEELKSSMLFLNILMDAIPSPIFYKNVKGVFLGGNKAFGQYIGKTQQQYIGKTVYDILPIELAKIYDAADQKLFKNQIVQKYESSVLFADGTRHDVVFNKAVFKNVKDEVVGLIGIILDITDRKNAEKEIQKWANIFKDAHWGVIAASADGSQFELMNATFAEMHGYSVEELIGRPTIDIVAPEARESLPEQIGNVKKKGHHSFESKHIRKDGTIFPVLFEGTSIKDEAGNLIYSAAHIQDITMQKRIELELRIAMEQAEAANIAKSQFLANMSHEIKTPMNGIMGFLQLIQLTELTEDQKEFVKECIIASEGLLHLINDILDLSKIEARKTKLENIPMRIRSVIEDSISLLLPKAQEKRIKLHSILQSDLPVQLMGDPLRLGQILNNLISNAVKFTDRGEVRVQVDWMEEVDEVALLQFQVKDDGIGISQEDLPKLFKQFIQVDSSTTRRYGGTGLGLAIARELSEMMDGSIQVESKPGEGSIFKFYVRLKIAKRV